MYPTYRTPIKCRGRVVLVPGFNVRDGGRGSVGKLTGHLLAMGYDVVLYSYGYRFLFGALLCEDKDAKGLSDIYQPGDVVIAHSNGCKLIALAIEAGMPIKHAIMIHPALDRDWEPPANHPIEKIDVYFSGKDVATWLAKFSPFMWGAMGTYGPESGHPCFIKRSEEQSHSGGFNEHPRKYLEVLM